MVFAAFAEAANGGEGVFHELDIGQFAVFAARQDREGRGHGLTQRVRGIGEGAEDRRAVLVLEAVLDPEVVDRSDARYRAA